MPALILLRCMRSVTALAFCLSTVTGADLPRMDKFLGWRPPYLVFEFDAVASPAPTSESITVL
jgi:hypothetical protein